MEKILETGTNSHTYFKFTQRVFVILIDILDPFMTFSIKEVDKGMIIVSQALKKKY
jgi:hypothetical protein